MYGVDREHRGRNGWEANEYPWSAYTFVIFPSFFSCIKMPVIYSWLRVLGVRDFTNGGPNYTAWVASGRPAIEFIHACLRTRAIHRRHWFDVTGDGNLLLETAHLLMFVLTSSS